MLHAITQRKGGCNINYPNQFQHSKRSHILSTYSGNHKRNIFCCIEIMSNELKATQNNLQRPKRTQVFNT